MKQAPDPTLTSQREALPMQVDVKIHSLHASGPVLADASVNLKDRKSTRLNSSH